MNEPCALELTHQEREFWSAGISLFNEGKYYESHEEFERIWLHSAGKKKAFLQILILLAAVGVHRQKNRPDTACRVLEKIKAKLKDLGPFSLAHLTDGSLMEIRRSWEAEQIPLIPMKHHGVSSR